MGRERRHVMVIREWGARGEESCVGKREQKLKTDNCQVGVVVQYNPPSCFLQRQTASFLFFFLTTMHIYLFFSSMLMFLSVRNPKSQRLFLLHLRSIGPSHFSSGPQNYKMLPNYSLTLLASPDYVWIWISATTSVLQKHQTLLL